MTPMVALVMPAGGTVCKGAAIHGMAARGSTSVGRTAESSTVLSDAIHSPELINLCVHIGRYVRGSLLLCAIRELVRLYVGRRETVAAYGLIWIKSPCCLDRKS